MFKPLNVLVACEYSGVVRDAFNARGHNAVSCDILPTESPGPHFQCDVLDVLSLPWDLMVAHPPCTYLANSGVSHLHSDNSRFSKLILAVSFFNNLLSAKIPKIAVENPIPHKYGKLFLQQEYSQIIHPWLFGHREQKSTCLWLKNLKPLCSTNNVKSDMMKKPLNERQRLHYLPPSKDRQKIRSRTFKGIANAMAEQWGSDV